MVAISAAQSVTLPYPTAGITITGLGVGSSVVSVWRTADGDRKPVRGARRTTMNDSAYVEDFDVPLGRPVTYEVEVLSGPGGAQRATATPVTINSDTGWLMDPLIPQSAVPIVGDLGDTTYLRSKSLASLEYKANVSIYQVMGSSEPLALFGQRMAASGVDTSLTTRSAEENARLEQLLTSTAQLLFRPLPGWGTRTLPGSMFLANPSAIQLPVDISRGGSMTWWELKSDVVAAPTIRVLTATFTYGDVQLLVASYQQKQDAFAGLTYLDDLKNPLG